ncbi:MAG: UPF0280 family protein [Candidatus Omnitrophica bacterium]|nr:UPF0280 family protein [Candidatus Omnitrophota bacterium]
MFKPRTYRKWVESDDLVSFEVREKETDLLILAEKKLEAQARESILTNRGDIERYIKKYPDFYTTLEPLNAVSRAPEIVKVMAEAGRLARVGPMAAIAGAMAEFVGRDLLAFTNQVIVENGGDIFIKTSRPRTLGIYAGENSSFTGKLAIEVEACENGIGVCTSSGTVSHSLSFGLADAVVIISDNTALADAVATAAGNAVKRPGDIEKGIIIAKSIEGVKGVLIIAGDKFGSWGQIKLV